MPSGFVSDVYKTVINSIGNIPIIPMNWTFSLKTRVRMKATIHPITIIIKGLHHWKTMNDFPRTHRRVINAAIFGSDASLLNISPTGQPLARAIWLYDMHIKAAAIDRIKMMYPYMPSPLATCFLALR